MGRRKRKQTAKYESQKMRTAKNKDKARKKHLTEFPDDLQAKKKYEQ